MYDEYKRILKETLSEHRYLHSLGVSETARKMAELFGENPEKAELAGLIHDCAKHFSDSELFRQCEKYGYVPDDIEKETPALLHAPLGALMLGELFGIDDTEIINAVRYHTTAHENMTKLDKIIYLADMIEPGREYPEVYELRRLAEENLDNAMLEALNQSMMFVIKKGNLIHPDTLYARNQLTKESKYDHT